MFRKPPKAKSSLFRQTKKRNFDKKDNEEINNADNGDDNKVSTKKKRYRRRSSPSSDEGGDDSNDDNHNTSKLLEEIKSENVVKKKGRPKEGEGMTGDKNALMHEYQSIQKPMTQQELATLQDQHHPPASNTVQQEDGQEKPKRNKFLAGPLKASKFIRTTSRFDYQPDICKDYKDTGFCGFGDSCIYLHDRTNMKSGYILEQEWEEKKKKEHQEKEKEMELFCTEVGSAGAGKSNKDSNEIVLQDDGLPYACHLCRDAFKEPIITICSHYFCQACILKRVQDQKDPTCPICNHDTNGVFNYPNKLVNKRKRLVGRNGSWKEFANFIK